MKCRILFNNAWQIRAVCQGNKPLSLLEVFLDDLGANYKKQGLKKLFNLLEEVSLKGPKGIVQELRDHITGTKNLYEFTPARLRVFYTEDEESRCVVLYNAYLKDNTKLRREIEKAKELQERYILALKEESLVVEDATNTGG